jgi:hypothetical protein
MVLAAQTHTLLFVAQSLGLLYDKRVPNLLSVCHISLASGSRKS